MLFLLVIGDSRRCVVLQARFCALYGMDQVKDEDGRIISKMEDMTDDKTLIAQVCSISDAVDEILLLIAFISCYVTVCVPTTMSNLSSKQGERGEFVIRRFVIVNSSYYI